MFRTIIFWLHLVTALLAGVVIVIMSATGILIAFEHEILEWVDREVSTVTQSSDRDRLPVATLKQAVKEQRPDFKSSMVLIPKEKDAAYQFHQGRTGVLYVNPYTAEVREPLSGSWHDFLHLMEDWHRWLGMTGKAQETGKLITGIANAIFVFLCLSGLYLWFPRKWSWPVLRRLLWFVKCKQHKARDFNWHNVIGFWSMPVLVVLAGTAVVFSFAWAHKLVFTLAGEPAPEARGPGMLASPPVNLPPFEADAIPLGYDQILEQVAAQFPAWEAMVIPFSNHADAPAPLSLVLFEPAPFQTRGRIQLEINPFDGGILGKTGFEDRSPGTRARIWIRFLHTGEAFGLPGKIVATAATAASLVLVYTGFALTWRRFFSRRKKTATAE